MAIRFYDIVFVCLGAGAMATGCGKEITDELGSATGTDTGDGDGDTSTGDGDTSPGDGDTGTGDGDTLLNVGGTYLLGIETSLGPDLPLPFVLEITNVMLTADGANADFEFQQVSTEQGSAVPIACTGAPTQVEGVQLDALGNFSVDVMLRFSGGLAPNEPPPLSSITLIGHLVDPEAMCGDVEGTLASPLDFDLAGSSFAAIPLEAGCDASPFPTPMYNCSML